MLRSDQKKIKIVRIIARLNIGGPAIHTILLTEGLDKKRFDTLLVTGKPDISEGDMSSLAAKKGLKLEYVQELSREIGFSDIKAFFKLLRLIRRVRPDIVHTHTAKAGALGRAAAIFAGVPVKIHTFHGHIFEGYFSPFKTKIFILIERLLAHFTDKLVIISDSVCEEIVNKFHIASKEKCAVIKLGFDLYDFLNNENLKGDFRKRIGFDKDVLLVGIVGRLVPIKNHRMFLDVARDVVSKVDVPKVRFVVIGDGELRDELMKYAKKINIDQFVKFTGWIEDTASIYADLDVVALTSLNEGTPVSLIEALASARPVVSTNVGGVKDVVRDGEHGLLAEKNNVKDFSDKLTMLLTDKDKRDRFGIAGREFVRSRYSKDNLIDCIEELYEKSLNEKGRPIV